MSMPLGQQLLGQPGMSTPKSWASKVPSGYKKGFQQQFSPEQMDLFQQMFGQLGPQSYLNRLAGGDQSAFDESEAPALRQFQQLQGQLGSRFSGMGMGAQKSSGFQNSAGQLSSDFAQDLASKRMEYRRQAINDLMGFSNQLLGQRPYEQFLTEKGPSGMDKAFNYLSPLVGAGVGGFSQSFGRKFGGG